MGIQRVEFVRVKTVIGLASFLALLISGCWSIPPIDQDIHVPGHTVRTHAAVSMPAITNSGEKLIVNGNKLKRYSVANELVYQTVFPLSSDWVARGWSANASYPAVYNDALGNLYLDLGTDLAGINEDGEIQWRTDFPIGNGVLFPPSGGILVTDQVGADRYLVKLSPDGTEEWRRYVSLSSKLQTSVAVNSDQITILQKNQLIALELDGTELWKVFVGDGQVSTSYLGNLGNLNVVCAYEKLFAFDETGTELWSITAPQDVYRFFEIVVLGSDRIVVRITTTDPPNDGLLILDGSGNEINRLNGFFARHITSADGPGFVSLEADLSKLFVGLHSADTGGLVWHYRTPEAKTESAGKDGEVIYHYFGWPEPFCASNSMTYFTVNSTLYELDQSGNLVGSFPSTEITEEWVDAYIIPW